jgi:hypothetical protein
LAAWMSTSLGWVENTTISSTPTPPSARRGGLCEKRGRESFGVVGGYGLFLRSFSLCLLRILFYGRYSTHPAIPGEVLVLLATAISDGAAPGAAERNTITTPTVLIGGVPAQVQFSGLSPQFVALNQINVQVPSGVPPSGAVPIQIQIGGVTTSNKVTIAVSQP